MINETLYCERLMYLEWAQQEFEDNAFTVDGRAAHRRADTAGGRLPDPQEDEEPRPFEARSVWLSSDRLGITAKIDVVEGEGGSVVPIEYKRGSAPALPEGAYLPERAQVCAQVLLLRDHGYRCERGEIYFARSRRRVPIVIDEALERVTMEAARRAKAIAESGQIPPPLVDSPKCVGCSLVSICLPDEVNLLRVIGAEDGHARAEPEQLELPLRLEAAPLGPALLVGEAEGREGQTRELDAAPATAELRRLQAARDERMPVYVHAQHGRIGLEGECLKITGRDGDENIEREVRLPNTSQVSIYGNVQVTTPALRTLIEREIPLCMFTYGGWFVGGTRGFGSKDIELRTAQHAAARNERACLDIARGFVASKILNARTMLRRNHTAPDAVLLGELRILAEKATRADDLGALLGLEGTAARGYFRAFAGMLKGAGAELAGSFERRNRRPPKDPLNALLSFVYALLAKDFVLAVEAVGLEPMLGFYHQPRYGRPALALDLMEEFRPLVADSVVIGAINTGVVGPDDFQQTPVGCAITPAARKRLTLAYERRMDQLVTHPVFGYRVSYRRVLEIQARLTTRWLLGEIQHYPNFRTR